MNAEKKAPVAPERAWIRPLRDSFDEEGVETDHAPVLLYAGHDQADADAAAEALSCVDEEDIVRGEAAEYIRADVAERRVAEAVAAAYQAAAESVAERFGWDAAEETVSAAQRGQQS